MRTWRRRALRSRRHRVALASVAFACGSFAFAARISAEPIGAEPIGAGAAGQAQVTVELDPPNYDGLQSFLDYEGRLALADGDFRRARKIFNRLLKIDPYDVRAMRELGRIAHALGELEKAVKILGRVDDLDGTTPDAEIHFIRGESLYALGRKDEAWRAFERTERDLGDGPLDRRGTLWLARIAVLRGDIDRALTLYLGLLETDQPSSPTYAETMVLAIEGCIVNKHWDTAAELLDDLLAAQPDHPRGRALKAWVLEGSGQIEEELALRAEAARDHEPKETLDYARALERANDYSAALGHYRTAWALGVSEAADGITRLERRLSPEVAGGLMLRDDPSGSIAGWRAAATLPLGFRLRFALSAMNEESNGNILGPKERSQTTASGWGILASRRGAMVALGTTVRLDETDDGGVGGTAIVQTSPQRDVLLQIRGDGNVPWHESASTLRDDGVMDTLGAQLYMKSEVQDRRVLVSFAAQARRLGLETMAGLPDDRATQLFGAAGVDVTLSASTEHALQSEMFDAEMIAPRSLTTSTVVSYRHYEMSSENPFGQRLVLVERSSIDELSGVVRRVLDARGTVGAELRGGLGFDWARWVQQWRAGASILVSATPWSRLTVDYDVASESGTGIAGRQHIGSMIFHVDL